MRIRWTAAAAADLEQIKDYLKERYPSFAQPTVLRLYHSLKRTPTVAARGARKERASWSLRPSLYSRVPRKEGSHRDPALPPHRAGSALKTIPEQGVIPEH